MFRIEILFIVALAAAAIGGVIHFASTLEDALITFRYSERWSEGFAFGMWNRVGEPVEGFTTFLWMILLAVAGPDTVAIATFAKTMGFAAHIGLIAFFFALHQAALRNEDVNMSKTVGDVSVFAHASLATGLAIGFCLPLSWYAMTGMETVPFAFLIALSVFLPLLTRRSVPLVLMAIAITLIRPEGVLVAASSAAFWYFMTRERRMLWVLAAALITVILLTAFRQAYFGTLLPNTYYAKAGATEGGFHFMNGLHYFARAGLYYWMLTLPLAGLLFARLFLGQRLSPLLWFLLSSQFAFAIVLSKAGGDNLAAFPLYRHLIVILPLLCMAVFLLVGALPKGRVEISFSIVAYLAIFTGLNPRTLDELGRVPELAATGQLFKNQFNETEYILWLASVTDDDTVVATSLAGAIPFLVDAVHIDVLGLNDFAIAHGGSFDPYGPTDSKTKMSLVIDRAPDLIEGYMSASELLTGDPVKAIFGYRAKMNVELLSDRRFRENYLMVTNAPYPSFNRILFARRDWLDGKGAQFGVEAIPLDRVLAAFETTDHPKKGRLTTTGN